MEEREEAAVCFSQKNKTKQRETNWLESASRQPVDGEAGRKKRKIPTWDIFITAAFPPAASCSSAVTCGRVSLCPARSRALSLSRKTSRVQVNRTAAANPRRVLVFVDYRPLSGEGGGLGRVGCGGRKKKVTDQRVQGLVKKKKRVSTRTMLFVSRRTEGETFCVSAGC